MNNAYWIIVQIRGCLTSAENLLAKFELIPACTRVRVRDSKTNIGGGRFNSRSRRLLIDRVRARARVNIQIETRESSFSSLSAESSAGTSLFPLRSSLFSSSDTLLDPP